MSAITKLPGAAWPRTAIAVLLGVLSLCLLTASPAGAASGELDRWGSYGPGEEQFFFSTGFGVDPTDNSVYVVDLNEEVTGYELRKFSADGELLASADLPGAFESFTYDGVAVDPELDRIYLVEATASNSEGPGNYGKATRILTFSTVPNGNEELVPPGDRPSGELPMPSGAAALERPTGIAVGPDNDPVVAGTELMEKTVLEGVPPNQTERTVEVPIAIVQRVSETGAIGDRFADTDEVAGAPGTLAVAGDGTIYMSGSGPEQLYRLPATMDSISAVGVDALGLAERNRAFDIRGGGWNGTLPYGPALTVAPDGTLYWSEAVKLASGEPSSHTIRGYDPASGATTVLYGPGSGPGAGECGLSSIFVAVAAGGDGSVFALEHSDTVNPGAFGDSVVRFGPDGEGCKAPQADFVMNGDFQGGETADEVEVPARSAVEFAAYLPTTPSPTPLPGLLGLAPSKAVWDFGNGTAPVELTAPVSGGIIPFDQVETTYRFPKAGTYEVTLTLTLPGAAAGDPPPVTKKVIVTPGPPPTAQFTASTSKPLPGQAVVFDASGSIDPTGSETGGPTNKLKSYEWDFGDGVKQTTTTPTVQHSFADPGPAPLKRTVKLVVRNADDLASQPVSRSIEVQVAPPPPQPPQQQPPAGNPPPPPSVNPPAPRPKPLKCRKGFKKKLVKGKKGKGKPKCVKAKKGKAKGRR